MNSGFARSRPCRFTAASVTFSRPGRDAVSRQARYSASGTAKRESAARCASAASRPIGMASLIRSNDADPMSPISITILTSAGPSVSSCCRSLAPMSTSRVRDIIVSGERRSAAVGGGFGTATAMTTSAQVCRAMSTGTLRVSPPSPRMRPSMLTGENTPGTAMLARIASARSPRSRTTISPLCMSVATARKGMGNWSNSATPRLRPTRDWIVRSTFCVLIRPDGAMRLPSRTPNSRLLL